MQVIYAMLCIAGTVLPLSQFAPWLREHGLAIPLLVQHALSTPVSAFAWLDVLVSAVVVVVFIVVEGQRCRVPRLWLPILGLCTVGVSLGLPLFLLMRERTPIAPTRSA